jgi:uncharacterized protein (TIGR02444 family)
MNPSLWEFSLAVYADRAVQDECLALQDQFGIDVNLILLCAFVGAVHRCLLTGADIASARKLVHEWQDDVVRPLRGPRRKLKTVAGQDAQKLRAQVKAAELEAERIEQTMLEQWAHASLTRRPAGDAHAAVRTNLQNLLAAYELSPERLVAADAMRHIIGSACRRAAQYP